MLIFNRIKMKKNIIMAIMALTITSSVTISCSDDFVDRKIPYSLGADNYFNNEEEYNNALIAAAPTAASPCPARSP